MVRLEIGSSRKKNPRRSRTSFKDEREFGPGHFSLAFHHVIVYKTRIFLTLAVFFGQIAISLVFHASKIKGFLRLLQDSASCLKSFGSNPLAFRERSNLICEGHLNVHVDMHEAS